MSMFLTVIIYTILSNLCLIIYAATSDVCSSYNEFLNASIRFPLWPTGKLLENAMSYIYNGNYDKTNSSIAGNCNGENINDTCLICLCDINDILSYKSGINNYNIVFCMSNNIPHAFHLKCMMFTFMNNNKCPICSTDYGVLSFIHITNLYLDHILGNKDASKVVKNLELSSALTECENDFINAICNMNMIKRLSVGPTIINKSKELLLKNKLIKTTKATETLHTKIVNNLLLRIVYYIKYNKDYREYSDKIIKIEFSNFSKYIIENDKLYNYHHYAYKINLNLLKKLPGNIFVDIYFNYFEFCDGLSNLFSLSYLATCIINKKLEVSEVENKNFIYTILMEIVEYCDYDEDFSYVLDFFHGKIELSFEDSCHLLEKYHNYFMNSFNDKETSTKENFLGYIKSLLILISSNDGVINKIFKLWKEKNVLLVLKNTCVKDRAESIYSIMKNIDNIKKLSKKG